MIHMPPYGKKSSFIRVVVGIMDDAINLLITQIGQFHHINIKEYYITSITWGFRSRTLPRGLLCKSL